MRHLVILSLVGSVIAWFAACRTETTAECSNDNQCYDAVDCTLDLCSNGSCVNRAVDELCPDGLTCDPDSGCRERCESDEACRDAVDCTLDICLDGDCSHRPLDELCPNGQTCDSVDGCSGGGDCENDEQCNDDIDCTLDVCGVSGCEHTSIDALCPDGQVCNATTGCVEGGCTGNEQCNDGIECTTDICNGDGTCTNVANDALCSEDESCVVGLGCATPCENDDDCQDTNFCNGAETCEPEFGCTPADRPRDCNDNEECTLDRCDPDLDLCVYELNTEIPECNTFDPTRHLNGCFTMTPRVSQHCAISYDFDSVCFELVGPVLFVDAGHGRFNMSQDTAPADANFSVYQEVTGGCTEQYTLRGTFTDADHFSGTWNATFVSVDGLSCLLGGCRNLNVAVTATRVSGP